MPRNNPTYAGLIPPETVKDAGTFASDATTGNHLIAGKAQSFRFCDTNGENNIGLSILFYSACAITGSASMRAIGRLDSRASPLLF